MKTDLFMWHMTEYERLKASAYYRYVETYLEEKENEDGRAEE